MSFSENNPDLGLDQQDADGRRVLIERVAASSQFRRSARLRDFLLYVGGQSLKEGYPEVHEQEIGVKVFGRSSSYDRSQDNIVRVNATELRKRIESYFVTEGAHEPLVFDIPRGAYKLVFHPRASQTPTPIAELTGSEELHSAETVEAHAGFHKYAHLVWALACGALIVSCWILFQQNLAMQKTLYPWKGKPAVESLWTDFDPGHQEIDIVLADASVSLGEEIIGRPMSFSDYLNRNYMRLAQTLNLSSDRNADLAKLYSYNLVAFGDFHAAQQILALAPMSSSLHLTLSRFFTADSLKRDSVILIGGKKANPWVGLFDDQMNFSLDYDNDRSKAFIVNRHPQAGEQPMYAAFTADSSPFVGYSVIAYLPNPSRTGSVVILAGTDSDATSAAAEFLTSEEDLKKFQNTLHSQNFPYFEVLLKTSRLSGTSFSAEPIAYRAYPAPH